MGVFDGLFSKKQEPVNQFSGSDITAEEHTELSSDAKKRLTALLVEMNSRIPTCTQLTLEPFRGETTRYSSKLGGPPYFPKSMEYPKVKIGQLAGEPLFFLAQLNFGELPQLEGFPKSGILQFFAGSESDDVVGMDFDDGTNQNGFRIIFHKEILTDETGIVPPEEIPVPSEEHYGFPFRGEFALKAGERRQTKLSTSDYRFEKLLVESYNRVFGTSFDNVWSYQPNAIGKADEALVNEVYSVYNNEHPEGTKIGGFPFFTQFDPRGGDEKTASYDTLLFQLDSGGDDEDEIMWGDCGVGNFFINSEALAAEDFSNVLYNWDCC